MAHARRDDALAPAASVAAGLRLPVGPVDLLSLPTDATPGVDGGKSAGKALLAAIGPQLAERQEQLFAEGRTGGERSLLLVLQGMDTSGKGGTLKHTVGLVDPQGLRITSFGKPSEEELAHDFLWRIRRSLPGPGHIGVFDRSHYEDVLVARVRALADVEEIERRYEAINAFEAELVEQGTVVVKCFLHISPETQRDRLLRRLDRPDKHWKYNPSDIDDRHLWPSFRQAYELALERTNTEVAPWYAVPSDHKWYRNLVVGQLLLDALSRLDPRWPAGDFDVEAERQRLLQEVPVGE